LPRSKAKGFPDLSGYRRLEFVGESGLRHRRRIGRQSALSILNAFPVASSFPNDLGLRGLQVLPNAHPPGPHTTAAGAGGGKGLCRPPRTAPSLSYKPMPQTRSEGRRFVCSDHVRRPHWMARKFSTAPAAKDNPSETYPAIRSVRMRLDKSLPEYRRRNQVSGADKQNTPITKKAIAW